MKTTTTTLQSNSAIIKNAAQTRAALQNFVDAFRELRYSADLAIEPNNKLVTEFEDSVGIIRELIDQMSPTKIVLDLPEAAVTKRPPQLTWGDKRIPLSEWDQQSLDSDITFAGKQWRNEDYRTEEGMNWFHLME